MSFQILRREEINAEAPSSKRRRIIVKQELDDDYPEYPTLMDLDPVYAEQVNRWNAYVQEYYGSSADPESESESETQSESESDSETETDSDSEAETETDSDSDSEIESDSSSSGDSGTDNDTVDLHDDEFRFDFIASESEEDLDDSAIF